MTIRATSLVRGWRKSIHSIPHIAALRGHFRPSGAREFTAAGRCVAERSGPLL